MRDVVSTALAAVVSVLLLPVLAYLGYGFMLLFAMVATEANLTDASWWKPFGYYTTFALFIAVGLVLLVVDVVVGFTVRRVFLGEAGFGRHVGAPLHPVPKRAW